MTKKFFLILLGVMFFCTSICSAQIADNRFFLGGLTVGSQMSDAIKIYGFPNKTKNAYDPMHDVFDHYWGNGSLWISEGNDGTIHRIFINADNGIATIDGVKVGMNPNVIFKVYGKSDLTYNDDAGTKYYVYSKKGNVDLQFAVKNGKIFAISLHSSV